MTESPISCNQSDKEEWCSESSEFTSCRASGVYRAVYRTRALVERDMFFCCDFPAECASGREETPVGRDDESSSGSERAPYDEVSRNLIAVAEKTSVLCWESGEIGFDCGILGRVACLFFQVWCAYLRLAPFVSLLEKG